MKIKLFLALLLSGFYFYSQSTGIPVKVIDEDETVFSKFEMEFNAVSINKKLEGSKTVESLIAGYDINEDVQFYLKQIHHSKVKKLFYRKGKDSKEILLYDPSDFSKEADIFMIKNFSPNKAGTKVCVAVGTESSKRSTLLIIDVDTRELLEDQIFNCSNFKVKWMPGGDIFGYCKSYMQVDDIGQVIGSVFYHKLDTDSSEDIELSFLEVPAVINK